MQTEYNRGLNGHRQQCEVFSIPSEDWDVEQILERLPTCNLKSFALVKRASDQGFGMPNGRMLEGSIRWKTAGHMSDPQLSAQNLQYSAGAEGPTFIFERSAVGVRQSAGLVSGQELDDDSRIDAAVVVNVAGQQSSKVGGMADVCDDMAIATRALKQKVAHLPGPEGFDLYEDGLVVSDDDIGCYIRPEKGNHIHLRSEDPFCDPREFVALDDCIRNCTDQWTPQTLRFAPRIPARGIPSRMRGVVDLHDETEDWISIHDRSSLPGIHMAVGSSGNLYRNALVAGRMMSLLNEYCEERSEDDSEPRQSDLPQSGNRMDVGFHTRKMQMDLENSFTVLG